ncbi:hypothetical protein B0H13DRAFT_2362886 [Mycena leptocephala]|nr:hypothetical protein B0H13DRAFT_2362886 [Mycena leptocephala]
MAARDALVKLGIAKGDTDFRYSRQGHVLEVADATTTAWGFGGNGWTYLGPRRDISWRWCLNGGDKQHRECRTTSVGTVMLRRARPNPNSGCPPPAALQERGKMSAEELRKWTMEGDRIQWFRAEAEMERWREQVEIIWRIGGRRFEASDIGHIAYAKRQAHIYAQREKQGRTFIGDHPTLNREEDQRLQDAVLEQCRALEVEEAAERHSREKGGEEAEEEEWETDNEGNEGEDEDEDEDEGEDESEDEDEDKDKEGSNRPELTPEAPAS